MKKVNIGDKEFSVELNKSSDNQMYKMLMDWKDEINKSNSNEQEDLWYQIPALPQFIFIAFGRGSFLRQVVHHYFLSQSSFLQ